MILFSATRLDDKGLQYITLKVFENAFMSNNKEF